MKLISIVSSYRKSGNTEQLVNLIEEKMLEAADKHNVKLDFERISLGHSELKICRGCRVCFDRGENLCPLKDELLAIRDKILEADGIIAASPVYVEDVNAVMKNWIDRMAFICHRPEFAGKTAIVVTTSGGGASAHALKTISRALNAWGIQIAGKENFIMGSLMKENEIKAKYNEKIEKLALRFFNSIGKREELKPVLYSLVAFKVQQRFWQRPLANHESIDYKYWKNKGWIESGCNFYIPFKANLIKIKFAGLIGSVLAGFFVK